jgi:hypothetical protein
MSKTRRLILDGIAACGLGLAAYGIWSYSHPVGYVIIGLAIAAGAEVVGAFPRKPRGL